MNDKSPKSRLAAFLLCFFLGGFGVHRFYVGKVGTGILMIFTFGGLGIWALIDLIRIGVGDFKDKEGRPITDWSGADGGSFGASTADNISSLEKLAALKEKGLVSDEEFAAKKKELLGI